MSKITASVLFSAGILLLLGVLYFSETDRHGEVEMTVAPKAFVDLAAARSAIESFEGSPTEFELPIADELNDEIGMNMAILTDAILARGWMPDGFEQRDGYRIYKYKAIDD